MVASNIEGTKQTKLQVIETIEEMRKLLDRNDRKGKTVGFVPTMGYLHEGHLSLVQYAREENDLVVMSIFVNPAQFGPNEDYATYPRDKERDLQLAASAGVDIVFIPSVDEMYPHESGIRILPGEQKSVLCGAKRPGHFDGVLKVILKLFNIVDPDRSYFGMKDAQQLSIIESFVHDFNLRTKIVRVPIVREEDGLAKSSRNVKLSGVERKEAPAIYKALQKGAKYIEQGKHPEEAIQMVKEMICSETTGEIDYVEILSFPDLQPIDEHSKEIIIACAVKFEKARLIDNIIMSTKEGKLNVSNNDE